MFYETYYRPIQHTAVCTLRTFTGCGRSMTIGTYTSTRPRGLADWSPRPKTLALLENVHSVLREYSEHLPLTVRQVFYRLVGAYGYTKDDRAYSRLCEMLVRARRARLVDFDNIRDDGVSESWAGGVYGPDDFWAGVRSDARTYRRERMEHQASWVEVWCEAAGMAPQLYRVSEKYGIPVFSSGGFDSLTAKYDLACRLVSECRPCTIVSVGDMDPSGVSIFDAFAEDVERLAHDLGGGYPLEFIRAVVTPEQVAEFGLPEAPAKRTDNRGDWAGGTVQAEALSPSDLANELDDVLLETINLEVYRLVLEEEAEERAAIVAHVRRVLD